LVKSSLDPTSVDVDYFSPPQLKRLLILASGSSEFFTDASDLKEVGRLLAESCKRSGESGERLLERAAAPTTTVVELRRIKELAKKLLDEAKAPHHREASRLLYHVAVAAAFGRLGKDISTRPLGERRLLYERIAIVFSGHPLGQLFRRAVERASQK
jgi:hypothetical protein